MPAIINATVNREIRELMSCTLVFNFQFGLLLIDTEGTDDVNREFKQSALIFALSTLISSYQIINIPRQIKKNDLGSLKVSDC